MASSSTIRQRLSGTELLNQYGDRVATRFAIPAGILVTLLVYFLNLDRIRVPFGHDMRSPGAIALLTMVPFSLLASIWTFVLGVRSWNARVLPDRKRHRWILSAIPVGLAYMMTMFAICVVALQIMNESFKELTLIRMQAALIAGGGAAGVSFVLAKSALMLRTSSLLYLFIIIMAGGIFIAMTGTTEKEWWQQSFSYLGRMDSKVHFFFNFALIFAAILLLIWMDFFLAEYRVLIRHEIVKSTWLKWVRATLVVLAVSMAAVGLFKFQLSPISTWIHNTSAYILAGSFGALMIGTPWIAKGYPREFHFLTWSLIGVMVVAGIWAAMGQVNTMGFELVGFGVGLLWLSRYATFTENIASQLEPVEIQDIWRV